MSYLRNHCRASSLRLWDAAPAVPAGPLYSTSCLYLYLGMWAGDCTCKQSFTGRIILNQFCTVIHSSRGAVSLPFPYHDNMPCCLSQILPINDTPKSYLSASSSSLWRIFGLLTVSVCYKLNPWVRKIEISREISVSYVKIKKLSVFIYTSFYRSF